MTYPYSANANDVVRASNHNANMDYMLSRTSGITTKQLSSRAGIVSAQMSDKFHTMIVPVLLLPRMGSTASVANLIDLTTGPTAWTLPNDANAQTELQRIVFSGRSGKQAYLTRITVQAAFRTGTPRLSFYKNGTVLLGAGVVELLTTNQYEVGDAAAPFDNWITPLQHDDYIIIGVGRNGASTAYGISINLTLKVEHGS
jgi:hypothetical protein